MQRSVLHSKSFQRYFLTYAAIFAAMIFISILLLARTTNMERARAAEQQRSLQAEQLLVGRKIQVRHRRVRCRF